MTHARAASRHAARRSAPTCPYCGVGCGVLGAAGRPGGAVTAGDPDHPANFGRLCSKGSALGETLGLDGRLLHPMLRRPTAATRGSTGTRRSTASPTASRRVIERDGPDAVAFYLSGQLLTEDYYVANKLMKGFLGSANVDTNSRLCMASTVAGHRRAFGDDVVPGCYEDLDEADLHRSWSARTPPGAIRCCSSAWCATAASAAPRSSSSIRAAPRPADEADLFLPIAPGTDTALFCGLLVHLAERGALDHAYIERHTTGLRRGAGARARDRARCWPRPPRRPASTRATSRGSSSCSAPRRTRRHLLLARREPVGAGHRQGQRHHQLPSRHRPHRQARHGAVLADRPAQRHGRPRGRRPRQSARRAHGLLAPTRSTACAASGTRRAWREREGLKAVQMFEAIERGEIKALWVMATNPAVSLPRAGAMREALRKLELFVVSENVLTNDTVDGRRARAAAGRRLGREGRHRHQFRAPHLAPARLPAAAGRGQARLVDRRRGRAAHGVRRRVRLSLRPPTCSASMPRCPRSRTTARATSISAALAASPTTNTTRSSRCNGRCARGDDRAARRACSPTAASSRPTARRASSRRSRRRCAKRPRAFPLRLNTGRVRDQWHTMTRTGQSPRLGAHRPEPFVEIHPLDAEAYGLAARRLRPRRSRARRLHPQGRDQRRPAARLAVRADPLERRHRLLGARRRSGGAADRSVLRPARGQGDAGRGRAGRVRLSRLCVGARAARAAGRNLVVAGRARGRRRACCWRPTMRRMTWRELRHASVPRRELTEYVDAPRGLYRAAAFIDGRLEGALFVGPAEAPPQWDAVKRCSRPRASATRSGAPCCREIDRRSADPAGDLRLLRRRPRRHPRRRSLAARPRTSKRSARRCAPAPNAAPACRN